MTPDITERARRAVAEVFVERPWDKADIKPETTFASLEFDSLDMVSLAFALESEFDDLEISDEALERFKTFGDVLAFLGEAVGAEA